MKYIILLFFVSNTLFCLEKPDWYVKNGKSDKYPESLYLTGYGFSQVTDRNDKLNAQNLATEYARKNLIEKVKVQIQSITAQRTDEIADKFSTMYSSAVQSTSSLELQGLKTEMYYDEDDDIQYIFVFAKRQTVLGSYILKINKLRQEISEKVQEAEIYVQQGKTTPALDAYINCLSLSRQLEEAQSIKTSLKVSDAFTDLEDEAETNEITLVKIRESIAQLIKRPLNTVDDISWYLSYLLKEQIGQRSDSSQLSVMVTPLTYEDTKLGSSFSRYFKQLFELKLLEAGIFSVLQQGSSYQPTPFQSGKSYTNVSGANYIISGSYWEQGGNIKFLVNVRSVSEGKIIASAETIVDSKIITSLGKSLKPENFQQAMTDQKVFTKDEIGGGGLTLETWTNRGAENLMFAENDTMNVTIRVNYPCYIRFIYHMADGKRVLMLDNYYMDQSKINIAYQIPDDFVCTAPFGAEILQVSARTEKFDNLVIEKVDGYNYLKDDLQKIVANTRGFKKVTSKIMQTEQRLQITTIKD